MRCGTILNFKERASLSTNFEWFCNFSISLSLFTVSSSIFPSPKIELLLDLCYPVLVYAKMIGMYTNNIQNQISTQHFICTICHVFQWLLVFRPFICKNNRETMGFCGKIETKNAYYFDARNFN